ncbi:MULTISPECIES: hypothetical protein [Alistipes]|jgi:hypothetical protein|uniref:Uncharacterized protein n=1 Tax=Alistipes putredinis DSM 17216 TaxID=445970 RepID=B0MZR7_9BACT|nr:MULTISPECIES: hypothetical protein [Alistipes]EDS03103.1 hypothetical protein ALIPUT_02642 [Alistipes putredinis DSM 17216]
MAIDFKKTQLSGHTPEIWRGECKILPGGFKPVQNFPVGTVLHRGTPIHVDFEAMSAAVCKTAKVLAGGTTTAPRIAKGHYFVAGDVVMKLGVTDKSPIIKSIDTANAEYDVLTFASAIAGLAEGDILVEASAAAAAEGDNEAVPAAPLYTPNMVVGAVKEFTGKGLPTIDAAYEAVVLYPSLNFPLLEDWLINPGKVCLKANPNILFIKQ